MIVKTLLTFLLFILNNYINCEVYTSTDHLMTLVESTSGVTHALENFLKNEYERLEKAKKY